MRQPGVAIGVPGRIADGGAVNQPLIKTFFATSFGVLADKFGVSWMVVAPEAP